MKNVYIVESFYHLLISLVKAILDFKRSDLIICVYSESTKSIIDDNLISRIKSSNIFDKIIILNYLDSKIEPENKSVKSIIRRFLFINKKYKEIKKLIVNYNKIYIFNDITLIGKMINKCGVKYILLEDGTDCYKNNANIINSGVIKGNILRCLFGVYQMGSSRNIEYIEVNDSHGIKTIKNQKIVEKNKNDMFNQLNKKDLKTIMSIFSIDKTFDNISGEYSILVTQPLYADGLVTTEEEQLKIYTMVIKKYLNNDRIIIKPHPRDSVNYDSITCQNKFLIIKNKFPLELINYIKEIKIKRIITISSTSVKLIYNCQENITLGWDWLDENIN